LGWGGNLACVLAVVDCCLKGGLYRSLKPFAGSFPRFYSAVPVEVDSPARGTSQKPINVTGLSVLAPEMAGKRLELPGEIIPSLPRIAILWSRQDAQHPALLTETEQAARHLRGGAAVPVEGFDICIPTKY
jgi:hypothetical protein